MRTKLQELLNKVTKAIERATHIAQRSKADANALSQGALASPSSSGDREHATNQATINAAKLQTLIRFKEQLNSHISNHSHTAEPVSFIEVKFEDGSKNQFYLVEFPIFLKNHNFVSIDSPLGRAILGKEVGESFTYEITGKQISGKIVNLE